MTEYVSMKKAGDLSGLSRHMLMKFAAMGLIRTDAKPGSNVRFHVEDAVKLAATHGKRVRQAP